MITARLRQRATAVLLDHRHASGRVLLVDPRRPVVEVDLDGLELDALLREGDADARAVRTARRVVERERHGWTPKTSAICSYSSCAGGSSAGDAAVRATARTRAGSAFVRRATTVGFAPSA